MQWCWVVPDLEKAMDAWIRTAGVGPFFVFEDVRHDQPRYRGCPVDPPRVRAAIAQAGHAQIELVCQLDDRPSFFRELVPAGACGLHHAALYCRNYDAELAAYTSAGVEVVYSGLMMGFRVSYLDTSASLGFMVELIEASSVADTVFGAIRGAAESWDGRDPIRSL